MVSATPTAHASVAQHTPASEASVLALLSAEHHENHLLIGLLGLDHAESEADAAQALGVDEQLLIGAVNVYSEFSNEFQRRGPRAFILSPAHLPAIGRAMWAGQDVAVICAPSNAWEALSLHLKGLVRQRQPDGGRLLFRFQDRLVLSNLLPLLRSDQITALVGPARSWTVMDECGRMHVASRVHGAKVPQTVSELRLDVAQLKALAMALHPGTVILQANEVDTTLLSGMKKCEQWQLVRKRSSQARALGLKTDEDVALYAVLSLQLPESFDRSGPVAQALARSRAQQTSFGQEVDAIESEDWDAWQRQLERGGFEL